MQLSMNAPRLRVLKIYERRDQKNAIRFVDYGPQKLLFPVSQIQTDNISESASRSAGGTKRAYGIVQTLGPFPFVSRQPAVNRLPTDTPILCHLGHDATVGDYRQHCLVPLLSYAHFPHARECQASAGTPVRHQPKPRQPSGGTLLSCFSRISTSDLAPDQGFEP